MKKLVFFLLVAVMTTGLVFAQENTERRRINPPSNDRRTFNFLPGHMMRMRSPFFNFGNRNRNFNNRNAPGFRQRIDPEELRERFDAVRENLKNRFEELRERLYTERENMQRSFEEQRQNRELNPENFRHYRRN